MRLHRLDLLRYGRFTDLSLDLRPAASGAPDLHILFGANEAGKSTALTALEDLLFGIPARSPLNFLHDYAAMRLGGRLQGPAGSLDMKRRKGNRETLLDAEETPLPAGEGALQPYLQGVDRAFFERMFSLDHRRLRDGGQEILEAKDEVGRMLFSAGAGIAGLRDRLGALNAEADGLWGPRRSAKRAFAQAEDRLKTAEAALREKTVSAGDWQKLQQADRDAEAAYAALEAEIQSRNAERSRLARIRRVHGSIRRLAELDAAIAVQAPAPPLPADARTRLQQAAAEADRAAARLEPAREQLDAARAAHDALQPDAALLDRRDDIRQLRERRSEVRPERASLPKRRQELAAAEAQLQRLATELDWPDLPPEALLARLPARPKLDALTALLTRRGSLAGSLAAAQTALQEAGLRQAEAAREHDMSETPADTRQLAAELQALRRGGDPGARIAAAGERLAEAEAAIRHGLAGLRPALPDARTLAALDLPPRAEVQDWRDRQQALAQRQRDLADRQRAAEAERDRHARAAARMRQTEHAVAAEDLAGLREERDAAWRAMRDRLLAGEPAAQAELAAHEAAIRQADALADRRFETAEAAARLAVTARLLAEQEEALASLAPQAASLTAEQEALAARWRALWAALPAEPGTADAMLDWLDRREAVLGHHRDRDARARELQALQQAEAGARAALLQAMAACGEAVADWRDRSLAALQEAAAACLQRHERLGEARQQARAASRKAEIERQRHEAALAAAEQAWADWLADWQSAATAAGLSGADGPAAAGAQVRALGEMLAIALPAEALRQDRILKIERDIAAFEAEAAALAAAVAPDLATAGDGDATVLELVRRLEAAEKDAAARNDRAKDIEAAARRLADCEATAQAAEETIAGLQRLAGAADRPALLAVIDRAEALRAATAERDGVLQVLHSDGDGLAVADLQAECRDIEIDTVLAREQTLQAELADLDLQRLQARDSLTRARAAFTAVGGDDAAAQAAADRAAALAEMQDVAERYVQAKSAALLLDWAIDRYRQEKQGPLLRRASGHFAMLTGGSFSELALDYGEADALQLTGRRPDGARVGIAGMSDGTADQLYLALRIAAVQDYLDRAAPLPFIADDLFVNFDDARAEAGFRVLGALAMQTQVLVFTHHRHLVDLARAALGPDLHCLSLADGAAI